MFFNFIVLGKNLLSQYKPQCNSERLILHFGKRFVAISWIEPYYTFKQRRPFREYFGEKVDALEARVEQRLEVVGETIDERFLNGKRNEPTKWKRTRKDAAAISEAGKVVVLAGIWFLGASIKARLEK